MIAPIIEAVGADSFVWASDYPHIDPSFGVLGEIRSRIASLSSEDQAKVMGRNAARFYGLPLPAVHPHGDHRWLGAGATLSRRWAAAA